MSDKELAETLRIASETTENIALKMLLLTAADRLEDLSVMIGG